MINLNQFRQRHCSDTGACSPILKQIPKENRSQFDAASEIGVAFLAKDISRHCVDCRQRSPPININCTECKFCARDWRTVAVRHEPTLHFCVHPPDNDRRPTTIFQFMFRGKTSWSIIYFRFYYHFISPFAVPVTTFFAFATRARDPINEMQYFSPLLFWFVATVQQRSISMDSVKRCFLFFLSI